MCKSFRFSGYIFAHLPYWSSLLSSKPGLGATLRLAMSSITSLSLLPAIVRKMLVLLCLYL